MQDLLCLGFPFSGLLFSYHSYYHHQSSPTHEYTCFWFYILNFLYIINCWDCGGRDDEVHLCGACFGCCSAAGCVLLCMACSTLPLRLTWTWDHQYRHNGCPRSRIRLQNLHECPSLVTRCPRWLYPLLRGLPGQPSDSARCNWSL